MRVCAATVVWAVLVAAPAWAQDDLEPRMVGHRGVTTIGLSGFVDRFASTEDRFPTHLTLYADVTRFVTDRIAVRGGLVGSTAFGETTDANATGPGAAALHALASGLYYFTPRSMASLYAGLEYRAPLTRRAEQDAGTALGVLGVEASLSSRASLFVEGGYGARLTRGDEGERQYRVAGAIGVRIRF